MNIGTTTGESALHLADAEPMKRSRKDENSSTDSSSGAGSAILQQPAPLIAAIGPSRDQLNIATKCAAKSANTM